MPHTLSKLFRLMAVAIFCCLISSFQTTPVAADTDLKTDEAMKALILDTIRENPEIIVEAMQILRAREQKQQADAAKAALSTHRAVLEQDPTAPIGGNPKGDVTVVEFFDYRCGYCKRVFPEVVELLSQDTNIRWVFKEFPILGPDSQLGAQVALAVWNIAPDQYWDFHTKVMATGGSLTKDKLFAIAEDTGIDTAVLETAMTDEAITESLQRNIELAHALGISGTPAFVIGDRIVPGAIGIDQFKSLIAEARKG